MKTYQDFIESTNITEFIVDAILDFKSSFNYKRACEAQQYYKGENPYIMERLKWFHTEMGKRVDNFKANNQVPSEFFGEIVKQENSYLFSNGVNFNDKGDKIKEAFSTNFDTKIFNAGSYALIDGVSWVCGIMKDNKMNISVFRGIEFIPLLDERCGNVKAGIRFWQLDETRPTWIELYEMDGYTEYKMIGGAVTKISEKKGYTTISKKNKFEVFSTECVEYPVLPIIPLYANDIQQSVLTTALKNKIDIYDMVMSDFANNLEDSNDVYWVLKNYPGQDIDTFLMDYKEYKTIRIDDGQFGGGDARQETIDIPFQARKELLEILRKDIYNSAMALDMDSLTGSSLTTTAIKASMNKLDLKTDILETNALSMLNNLVQLYLDLTNQDIKYNIELVRRTLINDAEEIDMIYTFRQDIDLRTALELNPKIPNEKINEIIKAKEEEGLNMNFGKEEDDVIIENEE